MKVPVAHGRGHRRTLLGVAAVFAAASLVAAGCSSGGSDSSDGKVTLNFSWWGDDTRAKVTQDAIDLFVKQHPTITVKTQYAPFGPYGTKLATQVSGGNAPDLFQIDRSYQSQYAGEGVLADLGKYGSALKLDGIDANFLASGKFDNKQIAVPFGQTTQVIVVDTTKLQQLGVTAPQPTWTWQDLQTWGEQVHSKSGGKVSGMADPGGTWGAFQSWQYQHGKQMYADGKPAFTQADLESFWNFTLGMSKSGAATPANVTATINGVPADEPLAKGLATAEWDYDSVFASYVGATKDQLAILPLPSVDGKTGMFAAPSMLLSVSSRSKHPTEAAELLNFLVNDSAAAGALGTGRGLFPNTQVRATLAGSATGPAKQVYEYEASVQSSMIPSPPAPPKGDSDLLAAMTRIYQGVTAGQQSVSAGAKAFMQQAQSSITS
ncbi:ABC transporter substrate-binding protein [Rugosimonospora africana]|uniref:Sugar ABC transporter substrate-binding protein n=1 Tax=Rugosimonospora africana TaxID=556532 RepID=A0A8J3QX69_9ACTN|nr:extracellular solute-binding protein [Rugosimonospora africana]GIH18799.1 sugar ABC transporter substrate-binding protein [Rugosimonospora africana]